MILNKMLKSVRFVEEVIVVEFDGKIAINSVEDRGLITLNNYSIYQYRMVDTFNIVKKTLYITLKKDA